MSKIEIDNICDTNTQKYMRDVYGDNIFFDSCHVTDAYGSCFNAAIEEFCHIIYDSNDTKIEELLGNVLEKHINQKETGSYYTPQDTTKYIAWNAILSSLINAQGMKWSTSIFDCFKFLPQ